MTVRFSSPCSNTEYNRVRSRGTASFGANLARRTVAAMPAGYRVRHAHDIVLLSPIRNRHPWRGRAFGQVVKRLKLGLGLAST